MLPLPPFHTTVLVCREEGVCVSLWVCVRVRVWLVPDFIQAATVQDDKSEKLCNLFQFITSAAHLSNCRIQHMAQFYFIINLHNLMALV